MNVFLPECNDIALFTAEDFREINQLADLLFNNTSTTIELYTEHEFLTQAWIASALHNSTLSLKNCIKPNISAHNTGLGWIYHEQGKLTYANTPPLTPPVKLCLPTLKTEQRLRLLHCYCAETINSHRLTIPDTTIQQALIWQSRYCAEATLLSQTITLLTRAANRCLLTFADKDSVILVETQHLAEVLADWEYINAHDLLNFSAQTPESLRHFLFEQMIGQDSATEKFLRHSSRHELFICAGPRYSGKNTFIESYARFTHAEKNFYICINLSHFPEDADWEEISIRPPQGKSGNTLNNFLDILETYPQLIIVLTHASQNNVLLNRLQKNIHRGFFQRKNKAISTAKMTWILLVDIAEQDIAAHTPQEPLETPNHECELSDILYRPALNIIDESQQSIIIDPCLSIIEAVTRLLPETITQNSCILPFIPLSKKSKKQILSNEIKRIIHCLRTSHDVSLYYQEEVIQFLLHQVEQHQNGFDSLHKNLYQQIEKIFLKALSHGVILDSQVLMLQLNDTGHMLQIVRTSPRNSTSPMRLKI
ncbi:MAG: hypothetical protein LRY69_02805 [Gammaproteobacteria bacterium]|nr:hypothetical protein [Gammaproteobacteria bacterium]